MHHISPFFYGNSWKSSITRYNSAFIDIESVYHEPAVSRQKTTSRSLSIRFLERVNRTEKGRKTWINWNFSWIENISLELRCGFVVSGLSSSYTYAEANLKSVGLRLLEPAEATSLNMIVRMTKNENFNLQRRDRSPRDASDSGSCESFSSFFIYMHLHFNNSLI